MCDKGPTNNVVIGKYVNLSILVFLLMYLNNYTTNIMLSKNLNSSYNHQDYQELHYLKCINNQKYKLTNLLLFSTHTNLLVYLV